VVHDSSRAAFHLRKYIADHEADHLSNHQLLIRDCSNHSNQKHAKMLWDCGTVLNSDEVLLPSWREIEVESHMYAYRVI
jgi:hypothetical protein